MAIALAPEIEVQPGQSIEELALNVIAPAPDNPRSELGDLTELAASMSELGLLQPLVVTPRAGKFMVVCGHRRYAAAKKAGLTTVPAIVRHLNDPQRIKAMVIENCQRTDLSPVEEARAYAQLVELGLTQRQICGDVGKSQAHISKRLAILKLPPKVLKRVDSGGITIGDALELTKLVDMPDGAIDEALRQSRWYGGTERAVANVLRDKTRHEKRAQEIERVKAAGIPYLPSVNGSYGEQMPKGTMRVDPDRHWDALPIKIAAHAKLDCHAATVNSSGERIYVCTNPKAHAAEVKEAKERVARDAGEARKRAHEKEMRQARDTRRAFVADLLTARLAKDDVIAAIVDGFILRAEAEARKVACQLLGLEPPSPNNWYGVLEAYAEKGPAEQLKAGLALSLATREIRLNSEWTTWGDTEKEYFDLLTTHGYETTAAEQRELAGKKPR